MSGPPSAQHTADIIQRGFEEFHDGFRALTRRSVERFERRDWDGIRRDTVRRLGLHTHAVEETLEIVRGELTRWLGDRDFWQRVKEAYSMAILGSDVFELAETFFNSLTRRVFAHQGVDPAIDFLSRDLPLPFRGWEMSSARMYRVHEVNRAVMKRVLADAPFRVPFRDLEQAAELAASTIRQSLLESFESQEIEALDFLRPILVRNKAAYLIGRARKRGHILPIVLAILNEDDGLVLDGVVHSENDVSIIFSFARWYFHADLDSPRQVIGFLHSLLPRKRISELYISLGYNKHGKSEFYGDLMNYIGHTRERFFFAPGQRGQVMAVFTLPSYEFVFKVIRDRFPASKRTTRRKIRERYRQVLLHDRVGRLIDFQEFEFLEFPRRLFAPDLLDELLETASKNVTLEDDLVVIRRLYVGRRVTPLDIYLNQEDLEASRRAVVDWGHAVKDLAAANIFAGDMLLKNFGVTRHGRVVFYDYDELCSLSDCRFRDFPQPRTEEQVLSAEPWFSVRDGDVFPAELETFLGLAGELLEAFHQHHSDLFGVDFWKTLQERNRRGEIIDFFPYAESVRHRTELVDDRSPAG